MDGALVMAGGRSFQMRAAAAAKARGRRPSLVLFGTPPVDNNADNNDNDADNKS